MGTEAALAWWQSQLALPGALDGDVAGQAYYSDWGTSDASRIAGDPSQFQGWETGGSVLVTSGDSAGNEVRYYIERLCMTPNEPSSVAGQQCVQTPVTDGNDMSGTCDHYPKSCLPPTMTVNYRVSTRVKGPRNTLSYIQVMLVPTS